jgi:hypothetical protein
MPEQQTSKKEETENAGAHSSVRSGGSDYNDGENVTHYLGNDDYYPEDNSLSENPYSLGESGDEDGKVAQGNQGQ